MTYISGQEPNDILDVLIVGAGISGLGCACYLRRELPHKSFRIIEARANLGGTWDLFRYPGIRSDSDIYTFGYEFKPWRRPEAIAGGEAILDYLRETAADYDLERMISYRHRVIAANWDSSQGVWLVRLRDETSGREEEVACRWIFSATGYYDYDHPYRPDFTGEESFAGQIIHPQHWPEDLDYTGKRIAVIGSGATAVTLLPSLAEKAAHVVQIQRTPTYLLPVPERDGLANLMYQLMPDGAAYRATRWRYRLMQKALHGFCQAFPKRARALIRGLNARRLPKDYPVDAHLNPPYDPWDQRLCTVPDGDLFKALREGRAEIVTGAIARFTETGILMEDGQQIEADIIVTATGLAVKLFGGIDLRVDGVPVETAKKLVYKSMLLDGVPNYSFAFGYTSSSWTLKIGLLCGHLCELWNYMDRNGTPICLPSHPGELGATKPFLNLSSGYIQRAQDQMPRQTDEQPWRVNANYFEDVRMLRRGELADPALKFYQAPALRQLREAAE